MGERRRSYREAQADGQREIDAVRDGVVCPHCGGQLHAADAAVAALPDRSPVDRAMRLAALEPTARRLAGELRRVAPAGTFDVWLAPLVVVDHAAGRLFVSAPAQLAAWIASRYRPLIAKIAAHLAGRPVDVVVMAEPAFVAAAVPRTLGDLADQEGERRARPLGGKSDAAPENVADAPPGSGGDTS